MLRRFSIMAHRLVLIWKSVSFDHSDPCAPIHAGDCVYLFFYCLLLVSDMKFEMGVLLDVSDNLNFYSSHCQRRVHKKYIRLQISSGNIKSDE